MDTHLVDGTDLVNHKPFAYSYNMVTYGNEDPRRGLERISLAGYERVELSGDPINISPQEIREVTDSLGLQVSSISSLLGPDRATRTRLSGAMDSTIFTALSRWRQPSNHRLSMSIQAQ